MDNKVFNIEFRIDIVRQFSVSILLEYIRLTTESIVVLRKEIEHAVLCCEDDLAVEYQGYLHNVEYNTKLMVQVLGEIEHSLTMPEATIKDVFLN